RSGGPRSDPGTGGARADPDSSRVPVPPDIQALQIRTGRSAQVEAEGDGQRAEAAARAREGSRPLRRAHVDDARDLDEEDLARGVGPRRDEPRDAGEVRGRFLEVGSSSAPARVDVDAADGIAAV